MNPEGIKQKYSPRRLPSWIAPAFLIDIAIPWAVMLSDHGIGVPVIVGFFLLIPSSVIGFLIAQRVPKDPLFGDRPLACVVMRVVAGLQGFVFILIPLIVICMVLG